MTSKEEDNNALISKIFKMVEEKSVTEEKVVKKKRTRKPMTPEQKAKAVANLKRGRETAMRNRKAKLAAAGKGETAPKLEPVKEEPIAPKLEPAKEEPLAPKLEPVKEEPLAPKLEPVKEEPLAPKLESVKSPSPVYIPIVYDGPEGPLRIRTWGGVSLW